MEMQLQSAGVPLLPFSKTHLTTFVNIKGALHVLERGVFNESNMTCEKYETMMCMTCQMNGSSPGI